MLEWAEWPPNGWEAGKQPQNQKQGSLAAAVVVVTL
jgi:hypothetical protein